jgi:hypothetical protein
MQIPHRENTSAKALRSMRPDQSQEGAGGRRWGQDSVSRYSRLIWVSEAMVNTWIFTLSQKRGY